MRVAALVAAQTIDRPQCLSVEIDLALEYTFHPIIVRVPVIAHLGYLRPA